MSSMVMLGVFSLILQVGGAQLAGRCSSSFLAPGPRKQPARTLLRSYRGTHPLGRSALSLLRCGERPRGYPDVASGRCTGTLRQRGRERLPGKRGRTRTAPQRGKAVSSVVTSGCPKRSEGGFPVGTRTITAFPSGAKLSPAFSSGTVHPPPSQASPVFPSGN